MRIYVMEVTEDYFDYDAIDYAVVLAENEEQAIEIAKKKRNVSWRVERTVELDNPCLVEAYIRHG